MQCDTLKDTYCTDNGISLLRISYAEFADIEEWVCRFFNRIL